MAIDASTLAVAFSPGLTAAVLGWYAMQMRRNGRNGTKPINPDKDPYGTRLGDVPVAWWQEREKELVTEFRRMRKAVEQHMEAHH